MKNIGLLFGALLITVVIVVGIALLFSKKTNESQVQQTPTDTAKYLQSERNVRGNATASATLVEFSDYQCPSCKSVEPLVEQLEQAYPQLRVVYRYFPLRNIHPNSAIAARAAEAARKQGTFWLYHDKLFANQEDWAGEKDPTAKFVQYAKELHLDSDQFGKDLQDSVLDQVIAQDEQDGVALGVNATPTFFLNGQKVEITDLSSAVPRAIQGL